MQWWCFAQGTAWTWEWRAYPGVWLFVALIAFLAHRLGAFHPENGRARGAGYAALAILWLALDWPLGPLAAGYLASAHALQFILLAFVIAPLFWVATRRGLRAAPPTNRLWRLLTQPIMAAVLFNVSVASSHMPRVVDQLMVSAAGAFLIDLLWLGSALLFWWPLIVRIPDRPTFGVPVRLLYLLLGTLFHTVIAMVMLATELPMYGIYELAPPTGWLPPREDQQLAGSIMELVGIVLIIGYATRLFFRWAGASTREG
jgi:putative membrane protein